MRTITPYEIIYARVDPETRKLLDRMADETNRTITAVLERAINLAWEHHQKRDKRIAAAGKNP